MAVAAVSPVILVNDLVKTFGDVTAVAGVSFSVGAGEIFGFLGPNGAGKSTTIKMLATLVRPTSGRATLAGYDIARQSNEVRQAIGLVQRRLADQGATPLQIECGVSLQRGETVTQIAQI